MSDWLIADWSGALGVMLSAAGIYAAVIIATRLYGLRSYSKMSSFDFAITVAIGTVVGTTLLARDPPLLHGVVALASIFLLRWLVSMARTRSKLATRLLDNKPLLLVRDGVMLSDAMRRVHVTEAELREMLREQSVKRLAEVRALVLERAGDVSIVRGEGTIDEWLMEDVEGWQRPV